VQENPNATDLVEAINRLTEWWEKLAQQDINATVPKAVEYGAYDLDIMGQAMVALADGMWTGATQEERLAIGREMACAFYLLGKTARIFSAFQRGERPSDDTWLDVTVYSVMARRIRQTGMWP